MNLSDWVGLGDKIQIRLVYQLEQLLKGADIEVKVYSSCVYNILSENVLEITMPTDNGKMVLVKEGVRCEMVFYTRKGLISTYSVVKRRYQKDTMYLLKMELKSTLVKHQRREYFRIPCELKFHFYPIDIEIDSVDTSKEVYNISKEKFPEMKKESVIRDISAGGIKFITEEEREKDSTIIINVTLSNSKINDTFFLICRIIDSETYKDDKFSTRGVFIYKDLRDRDKIVTYVLEEERKIRKKEIG